MKGFLKLEVLVLSTTVLVAFPIELFSQFTNHQLHPEASGGRLLLSEGQRKPVPKPQQPAKPVQKSTPPKRAKTRFQVIAEKFYPVAQTVEDLTQTLKDFFQSLKGDDGEEELALKLHQPSLNLWIYDCSSKTFHQLTKDGGYYSPRAFVISGFP